MIPSVHVAEIEESFVHLKHDIVGPTTVAVTTVVVNNVLAYSHTMMHMYNIHAFYHSMSLGKHTGVHRPE